MLYNENDKLRSGNKPGFDAQAYKHAISMVESSGGKFLENPTSSAAGKYHFLYNLIKNDPDMRGVSKRQFINNPELQEKIMDKALNGKLRGYAYGSNYAQKLKNEYNSDYDVNSLTAMIHFLGPGNARKFLKDPENFVVPGTKNLSAPEYLGKFQKHFDKYQKENAKNLDQKSPSFLSSPKSKIDERMEAVVSTDNTRVNSPKNLKLDFLENEFIHGGQMHTGSDASDDVTIFEAGGTHEENPLGGIPQGVDPNGAVNLVEENETKWNDYIFSDSIGIDGDFNISTKKNSY